MAMKILLSLLSIAVFLQTSCATPLPDAVSVAYTGNKRNDLLIFSLNEFGKVADETMHQVSVMFTNVVKDLEASDKKTPENDQEIEKMKNFIESIDKYHTSKPGLDGLKNLLQTFMGMSMFIDSYDVNAESKTLTQELFDKHDIKKVTENFDANFAKFADKFAAEVGSYLDQLSDAEKANDQKMVDWHKKFTEETAVEDKVGVFFDFIDLYDDSSEEDSK